MQATDLTLKELADSLDLSFRNLQGRRREGDRRGMNPIASTGWRASLRSLKNTWATKRQRYAGSSGPTGRLEVTVLWTSLIRNLEPEL